MSDPTWANHIPLLGSAGLQFKQYPYYDYDTHAIKFDEMLESLRQIPKGDLVLLHGCCHNPSGADLTIEQWQAVKEAALAQGLRYSSIWPIRVSGTASMRMYMASGFSQSLCQN